MSRKIIKLRIIIGQLCFFKQMESVKTWLVKINNMENVPTYQSNLVLHEMISKDIGIRGSDFFTITIFQWPG